ncbi:CU044_5270 family protein [Aeromicrobium ginsengisoli]|uniref:CU044_5270 family protein n=1 Tax=Aeromicrobium ginsengisoli TaxID=363867 RepID=A0A5M4FIJ1_9ACTN|nr:CU044_5270 family protein [Aeromicrobium ginsengisoli]KAA1399920.1 hypothetical protein ESP70_003975 [Aeromicrobium ginsengisoli]
MHIDDLLEETRPTTDPRPEGLELSRVQSLAVAQASVDRITHIARRRTRRRRTAGVLMVAAATAVVVIAPRLVDDTAPTAEPPGRTTVPVAPIQTPEFRNASQVLHAAGTSAAAQTHDTARAKYWRVDSEYHQSGDKVYRRTFWQGHTSTGYLFDEGFGDGGLVKMGVAKFSFQQQSLTWDQLLHLTTSKSELLRLLRADTGGLRGGTPDHYAFKTLGDLLGESPAPPAVRKAMWDAAAELKGVKNDGRMTDAKGRTGYGITLGDMTYVVEPSTGELLESRMKLAAGGSYRMTYLSQGPTDATPTVPTAAY